MRKEKKNVSLQQRGYSPLTKSHFHMKYIFFSFAFVTGLLLSCNNQRPSVFLDDGNGAVEISRIDPTDWYVGLKDPSLQLMVYGPGIREAEVAVDGAKVDSVVRLDSPNYLLLYLNLQGAKAGIFPSHSADLTARTRPLCATA